MSLLMPMRGVALTGHAHLQIHQQHKKFFMQHSYIPKRATSCPALGLVTIRHFHNVLPASYTVIRQGIRFLPTSYGHTAGKTVPPRILHGDTAGNTVPDHDRWNLPSAAFRVHGSKVFYTSLL